MTAKVSEIEDSNKVKIASMVKRVDSEKQQWKMCFEGIYEPLVFLKNPHNFHGSLVFGDNQITKKCPKDKSRLDMAFSYGTDSKALEMYNSGRLEKENSCPRETLRFDPPARIPYCRNDAYEPITAMGEFSTQLKYTNMPIWFNNIANRTDRILSAFSSVDQTLNLKDGLNVSLRALYHMSHFDLLINNENFSIPNLNMFFDGAYFYDNVKFESGSYWSHHYGLERMCSLVTYNLTTFDDIVLNTTELSKENCWTLLAADCSEQSRFSLFVKRFPDDSFAIKVYAGNDEIEYDPQGNADHTIVLNNENKFKLNALDSKEISFLSTNIPLKISFNEENLLVLETEYSMTIQYNLNNTLTFSVLSMYKEQICGLCAPGLSHNSNFDLCS